MIVTAMFPWYDEPVDLLRQAVRGASVLCDRLVAADGAYEIAPDPKPSSPSQQAKAIAEEAKTCGLDLVFLEPQIWVGQVAKRDAILQEAKQGSDWVMTLDADWRISGDRDAIRAELEQLHRNGYEQVSVNFATPDDPSRSWEEKAANEWHVRMAGNYEQLAFIYRVQPEMTFRKNHWSIYCKTEDGRPLGLFGANNFGWAMQAKTGYLKSDHLFEHLCLFRQQKQILRNREYIRVRDENVERVGYET